MEVDGSPARVAELIDALAAALRDGPPVLPLPVGVRAEVTRAPAGTAVVIATSGSTGEPKLVALSAAALRASARATEARLGGPGRWLLALPAEHVAGVQVIVRALLAGAAPAVLDLRAGFRADRFAAATAALGPERRYTSLVPTQLRRILDAAADPGAGGPGLQEGPPAAAHSREGPPAAGAETEGAATALDALRSYAAVLVGGAALDPGTRERARAAGVRVVTTYGMSETAGGCVYDGVPLDGVTVDLDPDGRILLGGPTLASGYLRRDGTPTALAPLDGTTAPTRAAAPDDASSRAAAPDGAPTAVASNGRGPTEGRTSTAGDSAPMSATTGMGATTEMGAAAGVGAAAGTSDATETSDAAGMSDAPGPAEPAFHGGRFRTGDLGRWRDGRLEVLGRADDVIVTGGEKVAPAAVESVLAGQPGVRAACVTGLPDAEWGEVVVAAVVWDAPGSAEVLRAAVRAALGRAAVPRRLVAVAEIPLRGIGKPDRAAVARLVTAVAEGGHPAR